MNTYGLVADVGGTNVRFALVAPGGGLEQICEYRVEKFTSFNGHQFSTVSSDVQNHQAVQHERRSPEAPVRNIGAGFLLHIFFPDDLAR